MAVTTAGTRALGLLGMLLVTAVGCYSPSIVSGGLLCAAGTDACPAGFSCVANVCVRPDAAIDQVSDRSVDVPDQKVDLVKADVPPDGPACLPPIAGCTPQATGACDPVCQTGCPCNPSKKCSVGLDQSLACFDVKGKQPTWGPCQIMDYGLPTQSDTCIPGDICLQPGGPGDMGYFCFPLCRTSADCTSYGSACVPRPSPGFVSLPPTTLVCDVMFVDCDPLAATSTCPANQSHCFLYGPDPVTNVDRTVCEFKTGLGSNGSTCTAARDCVDHWTCPTGNLPGANVCHPVCDKTATPPNCSAGQKCWSFGTKYGYCAPPT